MIADKRGAFFGPGLWMLQAAFPFERGPAGIIVLGQLGEDAFKVDLSIP